MLRQSCEFCKICPDSGRRFSVAWKYPEWPVRSHGKSPVGGQGASFLEQSWLRKGLCHSLRRISALSDSGISRKCMLGRGRSDPAGSGRIRLQPASPSGPYSFDGRGGQAGRGSAGVPGSGSVLLYAASAGGAGGSPGLHHRGIGPAGAEEGAAVGPFADLLCDAGVFQYGLHSPEGRALCFGCDRGM